MPRPQPGDANSPLHLDGAAEAEAFMKREGVDPEGDDVTEWQENDNDEIPDDEDEDEFGDEDEE